MMESVIEFDDPVASEPLTIEGTGIRRINVLTRRIGQLRLEIVHIGSYSESVTIIKNFAGHYLIP